MADETSSCDNVAVSLLLLLGQCGISVHYTLSYDCRHHHHYENINKDISIA